MSGWKRLYAKPAGSLPGGVVTQYGVAALTVFILLFLTYWIWFGGGEPAELPGATEADQTAPSSFTDRMAAQVDAEALRAETRRAAATSLTGLLTILLKPSKPKARRRSNKPLTRLRGSQAASKMAWRRRPRPIKHLSKHSEEGPAARRT